MYVVQAIYTKDNSPYSYSNDINKGLFAGVTINVISNNNQDITGANVVLENINGNDINRYEGGVANGKVEFLRVLKGDYKLTVSKGRAYVKYEESKTITEDVTFDIELQEYVFNPTMLRADVDEDTNIVTLSWGLGEEDTYKVDDGSIEEALGVNADGDAQIGNYFPIDESGQITSIDIIAVAINGVDNPGKVSIVIYNDNQEEIGHTDELKIEIDINNPTFYNIPIDFVRYSGSFYVMVKYSSSETQQANVIAMDTDENPGHTYYYDEDNGFVQLASWNYWGNFMIRANVLVNGKSSTITNSATSEFNTHTKVSDKIFATSIKKTTAKSGIKTVLSYNIFLEDMTIPMAEGVTSQYFVFNENDHLTIDGSYTYKAGVQAVFATGNSVVVPVEFTYDNTVSVIDNIDSDLNMYPNPTTNEITITNSENSIVKIYNSLGKMAKTVELQNIVNTLDVSDLPEGTYILNIEFAEGNVYRKLIIHR
jgi:hypothetical protein